MSTIDFYDSGSGTLLIKEQNYPPSIRDYLRKESAQLAKLCADSTCLLVEVGCMDGRYLNWAVARNIRYLGIDVVPSYVRSAREKIDSMGLDISRYRVVCASAENIHDIICSCCLPQDQIMVLFPFNCFGNMDDIRSVVRSISMTNANFLISTYKTDKFASHERFKYYTNCKYKNLRRIKHLFGVRFVSDEGMDTTSYDSRFLMRLFGSYGIDVKVESIGDIGIGYYRIAGGEYAA